MGGINAVMPLSFTPSPIVACGAGAAEHLPWPGWFTPPLSPPHQGEGDAVALSSSRHPRSSALQGSKASFSADARGMIRMAWKML